MGDIKVLSLNNLKRVMGVAPITAKRVTWHTSEIMIKQMLSIDEYRTVVLDIIGNCMSENNKVAIELVDFSTRINIISAFAAVELPDNIDELFRVAYGSDLYDTVCKFANKAQIESIIKAVDKYVQYIGMEEVEYVELQGNG